MEYWNPLNVEYQDLQYRRIPGWVPEWVRNEVQFEGRKMTHFGWFQTYKDFVNTRAILLESMILGCEIQVHEVTKLGTPQTTKDETKYDQIWGFGGLRIYAIYVTSDPS